MADTEHYVREDVRGFLAMLEAIGGPHMDEIPIADARAVIPGDGAVWPRPTPRELAVVRDLTCPGPAGDIPLRLYDARASRASRARW